MSSKQNTSDTNTPEIVQSDSVDTLVSHKPEFTRYRREFPIWLIPILLIVVASIFIGLVIFLFAKAASDGKLDTPVYHYTYVTCANDATKIKNIPIEKSLTDTTSGVVVTVHTVTYNVPQVDTTDYNCEKAVLLNLTIDNTHAVDSYSSVFASSVSLLQNNLGIDVTDHYKFTDYLDAHALPKLDETISSQKLSTGWLVYPLKEANNSHDLVFRYHRSESHVYDTVKGENVTIPEKDFDLPIPDIDPTK